jgi:hypothetical protein
MSWVGGLSENMISELNLSQLRTAQQPDPAEGGIKYGESLSALALR